MATPINPAFYEHELRLARRKREQNPKSLIGRGNTHRAAVRGVQQRLGELGYEVSTDGVFGEETEKALKEFQQSRGAQVDGIVGKETLGKLIRAKKSKNASPADEGIDAIQRVVTAGRPQPAKSGRALGDTKAEMNGGGRGRAEKGPNGGSVDASGRERASNKTGPIGSTTVIKQTKASWEKEGAGDPRNPETGSDGGAPKNPDFEEKHPRVGGKFAKKGDSGEGVQNTQAALNQVDKANLQTDGDFGPKTDRAVKQFQQKAGLTVDGVAGPKTSASLRRRLRLVEKSKGRAGTKPRPNP